MTIQVNIVTIVCFAIVIVYIILRVSYLCRKINRLTRSNDIIVKYNNKILTQVEDIRDHANKLVERVKLLEDVLNCINNI